MMPFQFRDQSGKQYVPSGVCGPFYDQFGNYRAPSVVYDMVGNYGVLDVPSVVCDQFGNYIDTRVVYGQVGGYCCQYLVCDQFFDQSGNYYLPSFVRDQAGNCYVPIPFTVTESVDNPTHDHAEASTREPTDDSISGSSDASASDLSGASASDLSGASTSVPASTDELDEELPDASTDVLVGALSDELNKKLPNASTDEIVEELPDASTDVLVGALSDELNKKLPNASTDEIVEEPPDASTDVLVGALSDELNKKLPNASTDEIVEEIPEALPDVPAAPLAVVRELPRGKRSSARQTSPTTAVVETSANLTDAQRTQIFRYIRDRFAPNRLILSQGDFSCQTKIFVHQRDSHRLTTFLDAIVDQCDTISQISQQILDREKLYSWANGLFQNSPSQPKVSCPRGAQKATTVCKNPYASLGESSDSESESDDDSD